jgi:hypothetical protein
MSFQDFLRKGIRVRNDMGELRETRPNSIVFPNGWVASIIEPTTKESKYSVAICDYNGYFNWNILKPFGEDDGTILCNNEEELCRALTIIESLK